MQRAERIREKILSADQLQKRLAVWRFFNKKLVFTNGCFDLLHRGHVEYLATARDLGQVLIVGLNTDDSVRRLKGEGRPVNDETARAIVLASLSFVDAVVLFDEDTPLDLITTIQPDILVKGKDYEGKAIVGSDVVKARGGEIVTIELTEGYSTSGAIDRMRRHHS